MHLRKERTAKENRQRPYPEKNRIEERFNVFCTSMLSSLMDLSFKPSLIVSPRVHGVLSEKFKSLKDQRVHTNRYT